MTRPRVDLKTARVQAADDGVLDAFFTVLGEAEGDALASAVCAGTVTGAALADKLGWTRDKASRRVGALQAGGIVEKRREGRWVRVTPQLAGVEAALAWAGKLRAQTPPDRFPEVVSDARLRRTQLLADAGRRSLLSTIAEKPGATQAELTRAGGLAQPAASRGLARLVDNGFVTLRRAQGHARHTLRPEAVESLWAWLQAVKTKLAQGRDTAAAVVLPDPGDEADSDLQVPARARAAGGRNSGSGPAHIVPVAKSTVDAAADAEVPAPTSGELGAATPAGDMRSSGQSLSDLPARRPLERGPDPKQHGGADPSRPRLTAT